MSLEASQFICNICLGHILFTNRLYSLVSIYALVEVLNSDNHLLCHFYHGYNNENF